MRLFLFIKMALSLAFMLAVTGCEQSSNAPSSLQYVASPHNPTVTVYRFAVHPLHNPQKLSQAYQPFIDYLNQGNETVRFELEASRDYQAYEAKIAQQSPAFLLPNPWQTLEAMKVGYEVIAMAGDAADFKGIFIVRKDSGIQEPLDLKGKVVSYPSHTALAAAIMPQYFLHQAGLDVCNDIQNAYVGSQESSIMNVYLGQAAAGATWPPPWRLFQQDHPQEAAQMQVIWQTPSLLNNSVMVRGDVPVEIRDYVQQKMLALAEQERGAAILQAMQTARFYPADNQTYDLVRSYIEIFEREVRLVSQP